MEFVPEMLSALLLCEQRLVAMIFNEQLALKSNYHPGCHSLIYEVKIAISCKSVRVVFFSGMF